MLVNDLWLYNIIDLLRRIVGQHPFTAPADVTTVTEHSTWPGSFNFESILTTLLGLLSIRETTFAWSF